MKELVIRIRFEHDVMATYPSTQISQSLLELSNDIREFGTGHYIQAQSIRDINGARIGQAKLEEIGE